MPTGVSVDKRCLKNPDFVITDEGDYVPDFCGIAFKYLAEGGELKSMGSKLVTDKAPYGVLYTQVALWKQKYKHFDQACQSGRQIYLEKLTKDIASATEDGEIEKAKFLTFRYRNFVKTIRNPEAIDFENPIVAAKKIIKEQFNDDSNFTPGEAKVLSSALVEIHKAKTGDDLSAMLDEAAHIFNKLAKEQKENITNEQS